MHAHARACIINFKEEKVTLVTAIQPWCFSLAYYLPLPAAVAQCVMCDTFLKTTVFFTKFKCQQQRKLQNKSTKVKCFLQIKLRNDFKKNTQKTRPTCKDLKLLFLKFPMFLKLCVVLGESREEYDIVQQSLTCSLDLHIHKTDLPMCNCLILGSKVKCRFITIRLKYNFSIALCHTYDLQWTVLCNSVYFIL